MREVPRVRPGDGLPDIPSSFTFCRLMYTSVRRDGSGNGWTTDFPEADRNLMTRLPQLTTLEVSRWSHGENGFTVVSPGDPTLYECPFIIPETGFTLLAAVLAAARVEPQVRAEAQ